MNSTERPVRRRSFADHRPRARTLRHGGRCLPWTESFSILESTGRPLVASGDFDGDGWIDFAAAGSSAGTLLYRNTGAELLQFAPAIPGVSGGASTVAAADTNNDGRAEVLRTASNQVIRELVSAAFEFERARILRRDAGRHRLRTVPGGLRRRRRRRRLLHRQATGTSHLGVMVNSGAPDFILESRIILSVGTTASTAFSALAAGDGDLDPVWGNRSRREWLRNLTGLDGTISPLARNPAVAFNYRGMDGIVTLTLQNNSDADTSSTLSVATPDWITIHSPQIHLPDLAARESAFVEIPVSINPDAPCTERGRVALTVSPFGGSPRTFHSPKSRSVDSLREPPPPPHRTSRFPTPTPTARASPPRCTHPPSRWFPPSASRPSSSTNGAETSAPPSSPPPASASSCGPTPPRTRAR